MTPNSTCEEVITETRLHIISYILDRSLDLIDAPLEFICEWFLIEKDIRIVKLSVEAILHFSDTPHCAVHV